MQLAPVLPRDSDGNVGSMSIVLYALALALVGGGIALLTRMVIAPRVESVNAWIIPTDVWTPLRAARSAANLDVFHLYEPLAGRTGYPYTPGLPILLAPIVAVGDHFHLLGDVFFSHRHPGMFWLLGPAEAIVGTFPIVYVAGFAARRGRASASRVQVVVFFVAAWAPVVYFHPEDTIALAFVLGACLAIGNDDWRRAGAFVAIALLFKQWALWPALPFLIVAPAEDVQSSASTHSRCRCS